MTRTKNRPVPQRVAALQAELRQVKRSLVAERQRAWQMAESAYEANEAFDDGQEAYDELETLLRTTEDEHRKAAQGYAGNLLAYADMARLALRDVDTAEAKLAKSALDRLLRESPPQSMLDKMVPFPWGLGGQVAIAGGLGYFLYIKAKVTK